MSRAIRAPFPHRGWYPWYPLHDDLAPLVAQPLEQEIAAFGINGGDAEHVTHGGIGGRTAALAQNVLTAGDTNDRVHGQKYGA